MNHSAKTSLKISIVQMNPTLGDFEANLNEALIQINKAHKDKSDLVVFSECTLFGYYPADLLERESIVEEQLKYLNTLIKKTPSSIAILIGYISKNKNLKGKRFLNSVALIKNNKLIKTFSKTLLPTYDIFDEARHFETGDINKNIFKLKGKTILVSVCEDIWGWDWTNSNNRKSNVSKKAIRLNRKSNYSVNPLLNLKVKPDLHINLSASPYTTNKHWQREYIFKQTTKALKTPLIYVNQYGAQDETIFDGMSSVINKKGEIQYQLNNFKSDYLQFDFSDLNRSLNKKTLAHTKINYEHILTALILGIKDFFSKTGFKKAHLGLSGGVDSALVYTLATMALGTENVAPLALPTKFNSDLSLKLAEELCSNLNTKLIHFPIETIYDQFKKNIDENFQIKEFGLVHENLQARIRANILMAYSNQFNSMLLSTSNKTEMAVGYTTLYGDMCGGLAPIGDLTKTQVYELCEFINSKKVIIPKKILTRAPSAELRENQKDQDSLPEYKILDESVSKLVEKTAEATTPTDKWTLKALMKSEFKRWQAPPVLKVTDHAFGRGRRFPIAHKAIY